MSHEVCICNMLCMFSLVYTLNIVTNNKKILFKPLFVNLGKDKECRRIK